MGKIIEFFKGLDRAADSTVNGISVVVGCFLWALLYLVKWVSFVLFWGCIGWLCFYILAAAVC